jgi:hypothetical protein
MSRIRPAFTVVPFNVALKNRARNEGATRKSLAGYARAGALCAAYCAHQQVGLLNVVNEEFPTFIDGLLGLRFRSASGELVYLDGHVRSRGSADLFVTLLYSLTGDVAHLYDVSFDWRRYRRVVGAGDGLTAVTRAHLLTGLGHRVHRIRHMTRKVVGLPDQELEKMLRRVPSGRPVPGGSRATVDVLARRPSPTVEQRRRRPAAQCLQAQAVAYFAPSRPAAELCGAAFARHVGRSYDTVKNCVPDINALKRAALRDKALGALRDLASGAQFIDQVSARHMSIAIGIRPELVRRLIRTELSNARAELRARRKRSTFQLVARIPSVDASLMKPFFFEGGIVDLAADAWDFMGYARVQRVVNNASVRADLRDVAWQVLRHTLRT